VCWSRAARRNGVDYMRIKVGADVRFRREVLSGKKTRPNRISVGGVWNEREIGRSSVKIWGSLLNLGIATRAF
jgi:hypothetical protein